MDGQLCHCLPNLSFSDSHNLAHHPAADALSAIADSSDANAIANGRGEFWKNLATFDTASHVIHVYDLGSDHSDTSRLQVESQAGDEATATDGDNHDIRVDLHQLDPHAPLPRDDVRVFEGVHEVPSELLCHLNRFCAGLVKRITMADNGGSEAQASINFDLWSIFRHHYSRLQTILFGSIGHRTSMVTRRCGNHRATVTVLH